CLPRIHKSSTDLTVLLRVSEAVTNSLGLETPASANGLVSVVTNLDVALRLQIPHGSGVLLLDESHPSNAGKGTGVILSPDTTAQWQQSGFSSRVRSVIVLPASGPAPGR